MAKPNPLSIRINEELRAALDRVAKKDDRSIGYIIKSAISDYLLRREREASKRGVRR